MSLNVISTQEKLDEVRNLIITRLRLGGDVVVLKAIAADLEARLGFAPNVALVDVERRVAAVARSKCRTGYDPAKLHVLGEGVAVHWPVIKQALERFGGTDA